jgi:hypothetical protein
MQEKIFPGIYLGVYLSEKNTYAPLPVYCSLFLTSNKYIADIDLSKK